MIRDEVPLYRRLSWIRRPANPAIVNAPMRIRAKLPGSGAAAGARLVSCIIWLVLLPVDRRKGKMPLAGVYCE